MIDGLESRMWITHHARFSEQAGGLIARVGRRVRAAGGDPLPVIGRALAFVLAASLASLTLGTTLA